MGNAILFMISLIVVVPLTVASKAKDACKKRLIDEGTISKEEYRNSDTTWLRVLEGNYISSIVTKPSDLSMARMTIVCEFRGSTLHLKGIATYPGDLDAELKERSMSIVNPLRFF